MTKITSVTMAGLLFAFCAGVLAVNCSGKNSADGDPQALCVEICTKTLECFGTAAGPPDCAIDCKSRAPSQETLATCLNAAELLAHAKDCTKVGCGQIVPCSLTIPVCIGSGVGDGGNLGDTSGAGGAEATGGAGGGEAMGGSPGAGGTPGGEPDATVDDPCLECVKADKCKAMFTDAGAPNAYTTSCRQTSGDDQDAVITNCRQLAKLIPGCK
jgi:hypothetical protein